MSFKKLLREVLTTSPIATETKDKETAETNDNDVEKVEKVEVSTATEILEENEDKEAFIEVVTTNPIPTETKDKEAAENNDNYVEKVEKVVIIGGFSTSGVSTDDTEILEENEDKVKETFNIFDPDIRDKGGGGKDRPEQGRLY